MGMYKWHSTGTLTACQVIGTNCTVYPVNRQGPAAFGEPPHCLPHTGALAAKPSTSASPCSLGALLSSQPSCDFEVSGLCL